jgi:hypothetical protein
MKEDKYPLTIKEFQEWLENKEEDEIVGKARHICACPLAKFLQEKFKSELPYVGLFSTYIPISEIETVSYDNPEWIASFLGGIDEKYRISNITATQALKILKEIQVDLNIY